MILYAWSSYVLDIFTTMCSSLEDEQYLCASMMNKAAYVTKARLLATYSKFLPLAKIKIELPMEFLNFV